MFSWRNKKNIMWIPPLICSYECPLLGSPGINELSMLGKNFSRQHYSIFVSAKNPCHFMQIVSLGFAGNVKAYFLGGKKKKKKTHHFVSRISPGSGKG